ncbi:MAG: flagellar basal-body rod protein FlgG [Plesiomonas sp.]
MDPALWVSKTGLDAQQTNIRNISNNISNASTVGFKKGRVVFEDLLYQKINQPGASSSQDDQMPSGLMLGSGTKVVATQKNFQQGGVQVTSNAFDMMIDGDGFFQIRMPDGSTGYTRNGQFQMDDEGNLVTAGSGYPVEPNIAIPTDATSVTVSADGQVSARMQGQAENQQVGQITLVSFVNPQGLEPMGENLYMQTGASGEAQEGTPGLDGLGKIKQGALESSNVNVTEELINLIEAQRVFEMNSKVISSVDEMLGYVSQRL